MKPTMIYGTAWKKDKTAALVELAIGQGFRAIDTACQPKHYNEKLVGVGVQRALAKNNLAREDLFLQTKFTPPGGQDPSTIPYDPADPIEKQIKTSLAVSKENLQTDYLDSLVLHSPISPFSALEKAWRVFEGFVREGDVKQIGISNCYDADLFKKLYEVATIKPKVLQNRFYATTSYDKELRAFCKENEISYQSFWSLSANPHLLGSKEVLELSVKYQKTAPAIFYRFLTHLGITPLNGTTSLAHMREDLGIFSFTLEEGEIERINALL
ncbi:aldo/keto reductase [Sulfurospirillum sp. T05]|uniref:Aldo/keto reductase n=1 Tax=Sulfurospirillum tamanense TaxID=2813362 RepID=A0ABS2WVC0_9BACT|nr:aldo/keto reductase [Sulfurospirillum tamanensis]MBN2965606.1 aldo/keto reductase [Sulfurospirillum tamanensis]